jgi:hypothetical protein
LKTNASVSDLYSTLNAVNLLYSYNIKFKSLRIKGRRVLFTLTVKKSRAPGGRLSVPRYETCRNTGEEKKKQRRIPAACWHVHGDFLHLLFAINPNAFVQSQGKRITAHNGQNWRDQNRGSICRPFMDSEACECSKNGQVKYRTLENLGV